MKCSWIVTLLLASLPVLRARNAFFDCNRNNIDCGAGGTCAAPGVPTEGQCSCAGAPDSESANADNPCYDPDNTDTKCTTDICNGNGDCKKDEVATETCFCNDLYCGTNCDMERVVVTCTGDDMTVKITPYGNNGDGTLTDFEGKIYATGRSADPACNLATVGTTLATFEATFEFDPAACGLTKTNPVDPAADPTVYEIVLRVQHNMNMLLANDLRVIAKCSIDPDANIGPGTGVISAGPGELPNSVTKDEVTSLVQFDLMRKGAGGTVFDANANDADITIGTDLQLRFFLPIPNDAGFDGFLVKQCFGRDAAEDHDVEVKIVEANGCPADEPVVTGNHIGVTTHDADNGNQIDNQNGESVSVPIQIFKFPGVDSVYFDCNVIMCNVGFTGDCAAPTTCTGTYTGGLGRRRREASAESVQVQARIRVFSSDDAFEVNRTVSQDGDRASNSADCLQEPTTQSIIAVFSVIVLVLLIACIVITACLLRRNRRNKGDNFDQTSATSSTAHLSIPRPRV